MSTKIVDTGIIISDMKDSPVNECVGFQQISHCDMKGKWHNTGVEVLQYCILEDIDRRQKVNLPCLRDGRCIWKGVTQPNANVIASEAKQSLHAQAPRQLALEEP